MKNKKRFKRLISFILVLMMTVSFAACNSSDEQSKESSMGNVSEVISESSKDESEAISTEETSIETSESSENAENSENAESSENPENAESSENPENDESSENSENVESSEPSSESSAEESSAAPSEEPSEEPSEQSSEAESKDVAALNPYYGTDIKPAEGKVIAFTFDDGPSYTKSTEKILDKLEELGMKATFFMVGERVSQQSAPVIKRMVELGCDLGNHSYDHPNFNSMSYTAVQKQINDTNAKLEKYVGVAATLIRPPYGNITETQMNNLHTPIICWDIDSLDWDIRSKGLKAGKSNSQIAQEIYDRTISRVHSGGIVLMHDIYDTTADAFCMLADKLVADGYTLVSISELLGTEKLMCTNIKYGFKW